jgi:tryptophanyl-tRNA synthetase
MTEPRIHTPRVFSGVQPSGALTLGNYLGAIRRFVELQDGGMETIYTVWQDPAGLKDATRQVTAAFLACGLDPKKSILFNQSQVSAHAELAWVFNCVVRLGWLNRMTQFKEKAGKNRENSSAGLFVYPALWARTRSSIWSWPATSPPSSTTTSATRISSPCPSR